jgi:glycosyltransferase involved in cell wall biosynthesis
MLMPQPTSPAPVTPASIVTAENRDLGEIPHILFIIDSLWFGGGELALAQILRNLPKDRYRASVIALRKDPLLDIMKDTSVPVFSLPIKRIYDWNALQVAFKLRRFITEHHISIVHTFFETSNLWGGMISKLSGVPALVSSRRDMGFLRNRGQRAAYRLLGGMFDSVVAVSDKVRRKTIEAEGIKPERVVTIHNGVELSRIDEVDCPPAMRAALGIEDASHVIVTAANLRPVKGIDVLLRAAQLVVREFPKAAFVIAGGEHLTGYLASLQALAKELGIAENVRFLGRRWDLVEVLKACDIFALLSRSEGFSNAVIEAMACELPTVVTRVGGNPEAVTDGETGFVVDSEDFAAAADRLLQLMRDPEKSRRMGRSGRRRVEAEFTSEAMVGQFVGLYDRLLEVKGA